MANPSAFMPTAVLVTAAMALTPQLLQLAGSTASSVQPVSLVAAAGPPPAPSLSTPASAVFAATGVAPGDASTTKFHVDAPGSYSAYIPFRNTKGWAQTVSLGLSVRNRKGAPLD